MVKCGRCGDDVFDAIQCSICEKHFDYPCSGISEVGYRKLGDDRRAKWKCLSCKDYGKSSTSSNPSGSPTPAVTLEDIMGDISNINLKLLPLSTLAEDLRQVKNELADFKTTTSEFTTKITNLEKRVLDMENAQKDVVSLKELVSKLEASLDEKDQWLRINNLEIKGVPMRDRENLFDVVSKIANKISYPVNKSQINFVHRVPTNVPGQKNIVVSFSNRFTKEDFLAAARLLKKSVTPADIGLTGQGAIYLNDHLTSKKKILLSRAKALAKDHNFQFVWVKHAKIFARRDTATKSFIVRSGEDLQKIC